MTVDDVWPGQEELNDNAPPATAQDATAPIERGLTARPVIRRLNAITDRLRGTLQSSPAFVRDTELTVKPRTYYFEEQKPGNQSEEAWAAGGSLEYRSGWLADRFRVGAEIFTSQPIYAPPDQDGTLLLKPGQEGYTVVGQAYAQLKFWDDELLTAGRSEYETPYVNRQFNRMTPNTFEGVTMKGAFTDLSPGQKISYLIGYLSKIKPRNSDDFIPMSQAVDGNSDGNGTSLAQVLFSAWGVSIGLADYYTPQSLNILYAEAAYTPSLSGKFGLKLAGQYTGERSTSDSFSLNGTPLSRNGGVRAGLSYEQSLLTLAVSATASAGQVISPWGSNPSYTSAAIKNTNRASEKALLLSYSYDFSKLGAEGLSAVAIYAYAWGAQDPRTAQSLESEYEWDLALDYKVPDGVFHGLAFRLQRNVLRGVGDPESSREWRIILNWEIPLI